MRRCRERMRYWDKNQKGKKVRAGGREKEGRKWADNCVERLPRRGVYTGILGSGNMAEG